jgi:hypothetical protein
MARSISAVSFSAIVLGAQLQPCAAAAASRTFVSSAGKDTNPCTKAEPCATLQGAFAKTSPGGKIFVVRGGDFGALKINHAVTIVGDRVDDGGKTPAIVTRGIDVDAGLTDAVVLSELTLNGAPDAGVGVNFLNGAWLLIDHCAIQGFQRGPAIAFVNGASLWVKDAVLSNDGLAGSASVVIASAGLAVSAHLERVQIVHAIGNGIKVDGTTSPGPIDMQLRDVSVDGSTGGSAIVAVSPAAGGPTVRIAADGVTSSHNAGYGLRAIGATSSIVLRHSSITDNGIGLGAAGGGVIAADADNRFARNAGGDRVVQKAMPQK